MAQFPKPTIANTEQSIRFTDPQKTGKPDSVFRNNYYTTSKSKPDTVSSKAYSACNLAASVKEALIAEILEAAVYEIELVNKRPQGPIVASDFDYRTIEQRFIKPQLNSKKIDIYENPKIHEDVRKLHQTSDFVCQLLKVTGDEMRRYGSYDSLTRVLENIKKMKEDEHNILFPELGNYDETDINVQLAKAKHELQDVRSTMESTLSNESTTNMLKKRYVQQWENARMEQCLLYAQKEEEKLKNIITEQLKIRDNEEYVSEKTMQFLQEAIIDAKSEIAKWEKKYEKDFEKKGLEIKLIREKREDLKEEYAQLCNEYYEKQNQINDITAWLSFIALEKMKEDDAETMEMEMKRMEEYKDMNQEKKKKKKKSTGNAKGKEKKKRRTA